MKKILLSLIAIATLSIQCFSFKDVMKLFRPYKQLVAPQCFPVPRNEPQDEVTEGQYDSLKNAIKKLFRPSKQLVIPQCFPVPHSESHDEQYRMFYSLLNF